MHCLTPWLRAHLLTGAGDGHSSKMALRQCQHTAMHNVRQRPVRHSNYQRAHFFLVLPLTATPCVVPPMRACMSTTLSASYGNFGCLASKCTCKWTPAEVTLTVVSSSQHDCTLTHCTGAATDMWWQ